MIDALNNAFTSLSSFLWGWPLLTLLLGTHIFLTIRLKFPQRHLVTALKMYFSRDEANKEGDISQFSALMIALAATVGTGNIIGVALAISIGGPGAVFWCWITGILGMATRYGEGLLAIRYRVRSSDGQMMGGPMYVLERGMHSKSLGIVFAILTAIAAFGIGNVTQGNAAATLLNETWAIPTWLSASVLTVLTGLVMLGGIKSIGRTCALMVPLMAVFYIGGCLFILIMQTHHVLPAISLILESAFSGEAVEGGFAGATLMMAMRAGVSRGLFSNEAGLGSAPIASAAAKTANSVRQALISSTGPFWDTVIICALTGIVITTSVIAHPDISFTDGKTLTFSAFSKIPYIGMPLLTVSLLTFVISTLLGWSYFGEKAMEYLVGIKSVFPYRIVWVILVFVGCIAKVEMVWNFADCANALMCIPNLISLIGLSGVIVADTRHYLWNHHLDEHDNTPIPEVD
ncbi:sodium:alanine symporter family protein [Akkermansia sp. N21116]|jgi:AGCS family alanine or glycine:cation symporter|uniref:alanine/glycine:cation symporter family protein n=1 Tax=Akkermansia sp. N21116 TaxID=3040764 RepID=UPI00244F0285|nr:sodium:alanine symporter family protein [Akkermansia sp. N21116]WPX39473.1 sodium:alanine symporter family protein [Akkermansia sp. N21116]